MITRLAGFLAVLTLLAAHATVTARSIDAGSRFLLPPAIQSGPARLPDSVLGVFEGRTPCSPLAAEFTGFPLQNCEKIKWELALHHEPRSGRPTSYEFKGTRSSRRGTWSTARGIPANADAVVYRLQYDSGKTLSLLRVDANILLILDGELRPMVGDASWSYTLSRTDKPRR